MALYSPKHHHASSMVLESLLALSAVCLLGGAAALLFQNFVMGAVLFCAGLALGVLRSAYSHHPVVIRIDRKRHR